MDEHQLLPDPLGKSLNLPLHRRHRRVTVTCPRQNQDHVRVAETLAGPGGHGRRVALIDDTLVAVLLLVEPGVQPVLEAGVEDVLAKLFLEETRGEDGNRTSVKVSEAFT